MSPQQKHNAILQRDHVTRALQNALSHPLVVLTAPMGYGKTTALRALMANLTHPAFFCTVNQGAGSERYLWNSLCGQLAAAGAPLAPLLQRRGFPQDAAAVDAVLRELRETPDNEPTLLIVDDWHFANFPAFDFFFERLVRERIPGFTLLLASRVRPGLPLEDLRIKGLAQVFERDLPAFSEAEAVAYFAMQGIADARAAREAWKACEGWPAALWLKAREHTAGRGGTAARDVEKLLESVILPQCGPEEQRLLVQLSLLDTFTPAQAVTVSGDAAAPRRLERLREHNALVRDDPATGGYRLHAMFRAFLGKLLDTEAEAYGIDKIALYRRAGESLLAAGDMLGAARFFSLAGRDEDLLRLLDLFTLPGGNLLLFFSAQEIIPAVLAVPWRLRVKRPLEYLAFIYFCLAEAGDATAVTLLGEAEERFARSRGICAALKQRLAGEVLLIKNMLVFNDLWAMRDIHEAAHRLLNGRSSIASKEMIWTFGCPHSAYLYQREPGTYLAAVELIEENLHYFHDLTGGCSMGAEPLFKAERLLERGAFGEVESLLSHARSRAETKGQTTTLLNAAFTLARLRMATGGPDEAAAVLEEWIPKIRAVGHVDLLNCLDLALGYVNATLGRHGAIPEWLRQGDLEPPRTVAQMLGFIHAVRGKAALAAGEYARADAIARAIPACLGPYENLFARIHAKTLEAAAARHLYGEDKALAPLEEALALARPDGIMLSIAEYGGHIAPLLRTLRERDPGDAYLAALVRLAERYPDVSNGGGTTRLVQTRLTLREEKALRMAAQGLRNEDIARVLNLSPETVKKTLSAAYKRLSASNRAEAVRRFLERG